MMHNDIENFDLEIRSMLENAEEAVPAGMWDGISSELKARKAAAARRRLFAVVSSAVSIAAAVAVAVILFRTPFNIQTPSSVAEATGISSDNDIDVIEVVKTPAQVDLIAEVAKPVARPSRKAENVTVAQPAQETTKAPSKPTTSKPDNSTDNHIDTYDKESVTAFGVTMMKEVPKRHRRATVITVGSTAQTNGDPASFSKRVGMHLAGDVSIPSKTTVTQTSKESSYAIPISVGLAARFPVSQKFSIGTGLTYSYLERTFSGTYTEVKDGAMVNRLIASDISNALHYVGVPLKLYYDAVDKQTTKFYAHAGMEIEKGIQSKFRVPHSSSTIYHTESIKGVQLSVGAGIGVSFNLARNVSLYLDPSVRYYFKCSQPVSIRTQQPLMLDLEVGLRFDI